MVARRMAALRSAVVTSESVRKSTAMVSSTSARIEMSSVRLSAACSTRLGGTLASTTFVLRIRFDEKADLDNSDANRPFETLVVV